MVECLRPSCISGCNIIEASLRLHVFWWSDTPLYQHDQDKFSRLRDVEPRKRGIIELSLFSLFVYKIYFYVMLPSISSLIKFQLFPFSLFSWFNGMEREEGVVTS